MKKTIQWYDILIHIIALPILMVYWFGFGILYFNSRINWHRERINEENN